MGFLINKDPYHYWLKVIGNYWMGLLQVTLIVMIPVEIVALIYRIATRKKVKDREVSKKKFRLVSSIVVVCIASLFAYGLINSTFVKLNHQKIFIPKMLKLDDKDEKEQNKLKIALIADTHLGYSIGEGQMQRMVDKINEADVDLVILAGDIFDNEYRAVKNPKKIEKILSSIKSRYGVYACWGNHDIPESLLVGFTLRGNRPYEKDPKFAEFLSNSKIKLLEDESILLNNKIYIFGRKDFSMSEKLKDKRMEVIEFTKDFDKSLPILMIDHQPKELDKARDAGVDLALSGHTHNGQIFPGNLAVKIPWENPYGVLKKGEMFSCVTSGVGAFGPAMRIGSNAEVMLLDVTFLSEK